MENTPNYDAAFEGASDQDATFATANPQTGFPEARGIVFTKMYLTSPEGDVVEFNVTTRGASGSEASDEMMETARHNAKKYGMTLVDPRTKRTQAPKSTPAAPATPPAPSVPAAPAAPKPPAAPAAHPNGSQPPALQELHSVKMDIDPMPADGKVTLKFYAAGHKFPDITCTKSADGILTMLANTGDWTEEHLQYKGTYNVNHRVVWYNSDKLNSKGAPYKNIHTLEAE